MRTQSIALLWDSSHIWGLMAWRALRALGLPCQLVKGKEIAKGNLLRNTTTRLLLVPGGNARLKSMALDEAGMSQIRIFVANGGQYLGFCGGAGLALTQNKSLHLCPWSRNPYTDRLQHLASGHLKAKLACHDLVPKKLQNTQISLPVWWPGRFAQDASQNVEVLAKAIASDHDFWLGDLPLASIPEHFFTILRNEYGVDLSSAYLADIPLVVTGRYGQGRYVLSYSHLETPESSTANSWLASLLETFLDQSISQTNIPPWDLDQQDFQWPKNTNTSPLYTALAQTRDLLNLGTDHHLFFRRTPWLWGWRTGLPGAPLNFLHTAIWTLLSLPPNKKALQYWEGVHDQFQKNFVLFCNVAEENLLTNRVAYALKNVLPKQETTWEHVLRSKAIFGCPRNEGGLLGPILTILEEIIYLAQEAE